MNECSLAKKMIHSITNSSKFQDEREQLESYKIATISLSILIILLTISSIIRETIEIRFGIVYPFSMTQEIFLYLGLIGLVGSYLLCKKGVIDISSFGLLILGITFPIYFGNILSDILLERIFHNSLNSQKANINLIIILFMFVFPIIIYFTLNKVYKKSISHSED